MSHRSFSRDNESFRPWKQGEDRDSGFARKPRAARDFKRRDEAVGPGDGENADGTYRTDNVWRSRDAEEASGFDRERPVSQDKEEGGFGLKPRRARRDDGEGGGGFDRRPRFRRDEGEGGGGFDRKPYFRRDRDEGEGGGWFDRSPRFRRDDSEGGGFGRPRFRRDRDEGGGGFDRRPRFHRDRDDGDRGFPRRRRFDDDRPARPRKRFDDAMPTEPAPEGELIYGRQPVTELLAAGRRAIHEILIQDSVKETEEITSLETLCKEKNIPVRRCKKADFDAWVSGANHQGVLAACDPYPYADIDAILEELKTKEGSGLLVLLDHVVDPQNLGSLLRTSDAAGVLGVVIPEDRAVGVTPAAFRASSGAAEHLKIAMVSSLNTVMEKLKDKEMGVWITGLDVCEEAKPYTEVDFKGKVALVIGSEGDGLSKTTREKCDFLAKLPMRGKVASLNAGVAGALAMYEVLRQQGVQ